MIKREGGGRKREREREKERERERERPLVVKGGGEMPNIAC